MPQKYQTKCHKNTKRSADILCLSYAEECAPSGSLGEARLWETPYKHEVRHAVIGQPLHHHSHVGDVRSVPDTEDVVFICNSYILTKIAVLSYTRKEKFQTKCGEYSGNISNFVRY